MTDLYLKHMIDHAHTRRQMWKHHHLQILPRIADIEQTTIIGSFSMILMETRERLIKLPACVEIEPGIFETPSAIARDYLYKKFGRGGHAKHSQMVEVVSGLRPMPLFAIPTHFTNGFYIDIQACYWSMMLRAGWNVDYWPGRWVTRGVPPGDFPFPEEKLARNCLVSAGLTSDMIMWTREEGLVSVEKGNRFANLQLYRLISDTLNSIAAEARDAGAVYVNTDGFIAPDPVRRDRIEAIIKGWGLPARIKAAGHGWVRGPGDYKVGQARSRRGLESEVAIHNIYPPHYSQWLRAKMQWLAGFIPS